MDHSVLITYLQSQKTPVTAKKVATDLKCSKPEVNRSLYELLNTNKVKRTSETPPEWSLVTTTTEEKKDPPTTSSSSDVSVVMVDLGNVHDTLPNIEKYARQGLVRVYAFADLAFNGYGINPRCDPSIFLFQSTTPDKNAADIEMVWKCAEISLMENPRNHSLQFYIVTRDQGFRTLGDILRRQGHEVEFVRGWDDLKMFIE